MQSQSVLARLTPFFAVVTLPAGILAAMFLGLPMGLAVFVVGWLLLTPGSAVLFGSPAGHPLSQGRVDDEMEELVAERMKEKLREKTDGRSTNRDPIEEIRERYARGEIDEVELERRLDVLLETEDVDPDDEESVERAVRNIETGESGGDGSEETGTESRSSEPVTDRE